MECLCRCTERFFRGPAPSTGCTYSTGAAVAGRAASPTFSAPTGAILTFKTARSTEDVCGSFDRTFILFSQDGGASFSSLKLIGSITIGDQILAGGGEICGDSLTAQTVTALLPPGATNVAFDFDSVDEVLNGFSGQFVDDVVVTPCPSEGCPAPPGFTAAITVDETFPDSFSPFPSDDDCPPSLPCRVWFDLDVTTEGQSSQDITLISPPGFHVAGGATVDNGVETGWFSFTIRTILQDFVNCNFDVGDSGFLVDGALPGEKMDGADLADLLDPNKWPTALDTEPRVAALVASGHTVIRRAVATDLTVATIPIPINVLFFDVSDGNGFGGLTIAGTYAVVVVGPSDPPLTDVSCTPLTIDSVLFGETVGGQLLFRCDVGGPHTFAIVVTNSGSSAVAAIVKDNPNDCGPPFTPTPTPTVTPTPTPVPTSKPPPTPKVTPTPNATAIANGSLMKIDADCEDPLGLPKDSSVEVQRVMLVGDTFHVCVNATFPSASAAGYQVRMHWTEAVLDLNQRNAGLNDRWRLQDPTVGGPPTAGVPQQTLGPADDKSGSDAYILLRTVDSGSQNASPRYEEKPVAWFEFVCQAHGAANIELRLPGAVDGSSFIEGGTKTEIKPALESAVIICLTPDDDSDVDGCTNEAELRSKANASTGGGRDPLYFWDFFDTWAAGLRTRNIDGFDIGGVVARFGTVSVPPLTKEEALAEALTPPTDTTGYHAAYDRDSPDPEANVWNMGPPSGNIDGFDIGGVVVQFGHTCVVLP